MKQCPRCGVEHAPDESCVILEISDEGIITSVTIIAPYHFPWNTEAKEKS